MIKISYELAFRNIDFGKFEQPELINLIFDLGKYEFIICSFCNDLFDEDNHYLGAIGVKKKNKYIYYNKDFACCDTYGHIGRKKIINTPKYRKTILNLHNKINYYLDEHTKYFDSFSDTEQTLTNKKREEIMDIWQLVVKNIFSERTK